MGCGRLGFDELTTSEQARGTLAVGVGFACAIRDARVFCWGEAGGGQLGVPDLGFSPTPLEVSGLPDPVALGVGDVHACAVTGTGDLYCWGSNDHLQLGAPRPQKLGLPGDFRPDPIRIAGLPLPVIAVGGGAQHTCALLEDRTVWCWGSNRTGQLGRGNLEEVDEVPDVVPGLTDVAELAISDDSSCVRHTTGKVSCWGEGGSGHLGDGTNANRGTPREIAGLVAEALTLGGDHACALAGGRYTCWGGNASGQHGNGTDVGTNRPDPASLLDGFVVISAAFTHTCAIRDDGSLLCWGGNNEATLGDGTTESRSSPTAVDAGGRVVAIATGLFSTCAIREDNAVLCWGWGSRGGVGDGRSAASRPQAVGISASRVAAGRLHTCAVTAGGNVSCWGVGDSGQLGDGASVLRLAPTTTTRAWTMDVVDITLGDRHTCALTVNGEVWCWGDNGSGQLGDGTTTASPLPVKAQVPAMSKIDAGDAHTCGLVTADSRVMCWGYNEHGTLGNGQTIDSSAPVDVLDDTGITLLATDLVVGDVHACAVRGTDVLCWGSNDRGQGGGITGDQAKAVTVAGVVTDRLIGGANTVCANDAAATPLCWGANDNNILIPDDLNPIVPTRVVYPNGFTLSRTTACGIAEGCWGSNYLGQLGDGSFSSRIDPAPIVDLPVAPSAIAPGIDHTCAIANGQVFCWGDNVNGQLGIGTSTRAREPTQVIGLP